VLNEGFLVKGTFPSGSKNEGIKWYLTSPRDHLGVSHAPNRKDGRRFRYANIVKRPWGGAELGITCVAKFKQAGAVKASKSKENEKRRGIEGSFSPPKSF